MPIILFWVYVLLDNLIFVIIFIIYIVYHAKKILSLCDEGTVFAWGFVFDYYPKSLHSR